MPTDYAIKNGRTVFDATTYTGNGSTQSITNAGGFKPDLVWMKGRNYAVNNVLNDSVRGISKFLFSDSTSAELTNTGYGVTAFNSNGFTAVDDSTGSYGSNGSSKTYVAWQWQAGQGSTSSNTSGSITSTVSVNATAGFSIVRYQGNSVSGATVGHGLSVVPSLVIIKPLAFGDTGWAVKHTSLPSGNNLILNSTGSHGNNGGYGVIGDLSSSSTITLLSGSNGIPYVNNSSSAYIAYCWAEVAGFSKFGSYTGNGSTDGPFIYTGFRPKFLLIKSASASATSWLMLDSSRNSYNIVNSYLISDSSAAEGTYAGWDFLSNGFKIRNTAANGSGESVIYAAFAENPFKYANAR